MDLASVELRRAYRFRLYPTDVQVAELSEWERQLRFLWNLAHEQRLLAMLRPREGRPRVDYYRQAREMTEIVRADSQLARVVCCARQEILRDLDKAWQRFFKRLAGRPRFKARIDSARIYFSTPKHWSVSGGALSLAGAAASVGPIKIRQDRPWPGNATFSSCHLVRDVDQWFAVFPLAFSAEVARPRQAAVGINRGAIHAIADSDGRVVNSPAYYDKALSRIALLSRRLTRTQKGSRNRAKAAEKLAKKHRLVRRQREWWLHQQSAYYAARYALIGIEDLSTKKIVADPKTEEKHHYSRSCKRHGCDDPVVKRRLCQRHYDEERFIPKRVVHRSILDVGWAELARQLKYKAQPAGGVVVAVTPGLEHPAAFEDPSLGQGISKTCSGCGAALDRAASGRAVMLCPKCSKTELGDINAAENVRARALRAQAPEPKARKTIQIKGRKRKQ